MYKKISIDITQPQVRKLGTGKTVSISASQLKGSGTSLYVHPANYEKIQKAIKANRGTRLCIAHGEMQHDLKQGGSVWSWLKDTLWPAVKPAISGVLDAAVQPVATALGPYGMAAPAGRALIKNLVGVGVKGKLKKGSPEAKAHMAALRAKRRGGSMRAGSFKIP